MPAVTTYALLDCAAYEDAFVTLTAGYSLTRWQSLFAGTPESSLQSAAPILIDLDSAGDGIPLRAWLLQLERVAPGVSWIDSEYSLPVLAGMLTNRLPCIIDGDKEVVMRFYDPRILFGLPSALDAKRKAWFFAPVLRWTAWEPRREEHYGIDAPPRPSADDMARFGVMPLTLDLQQRERLMYYDRETLYDSIVEHWAKTCPRSIKEITPNMQREIAAVAVARCASYGIRGAADQHLFAGLMMTISPSFDEHPAVRRYLRDPDLAPADRLDAMIAGLPDQVWHELETHQRMDALFEHAPAA